MGHIVHLALKVDEVETTGEFYKKVFGFQDAETTKTRDHISRHMTDGEIDFTLLQYDAGTQSAESKASGDGPCIHHFAIEVEDIAAATAQIKSYGCEIVSDPGVMPVKFRAPGGTVAELVQIGRYKKVPGRAQDRPHRAPGAEGGRDRENRRLLPEGVRVPRFGDQEDARSRVAPHDRRQHRLHASEVRRGHAVGGIEGGGRRPVHPPLRGRGRRYRKGDAADQGERCGHRQRSRRDSGQVSRARRHDCRAGAVGRYQR